MAIRFDVPLYGLLSKASSPSLPLQPPFFPSPPPPPPLRKPRSQGGSVGIAFRSSKSRNWAIRAAKGIGRAEDSVVVKDKSVSVVLLAGGKGKRMGASMPKQYLPLLGQPIALYSFYTFSQMSEVKEIVVVCDPSYQDVFEGLKAVRSLSSSIFIPDLQFGQFIILCVQLHYAIYMKRLSLCFPTSDVIEDVQVNIKFALPGKERQDSVFSGFQEIDGDTELVCIHDSARPLASSGDIKKVLRDGWLNGAAVLGVPVKATIKEANSDSFVVKTLDRKTLWEMQTPQVIKPDLLRAGFELVNREGLQVTDDVSIVEHLKHPVYITEGSYTNIKVTTPDDLLVAERILNMNAGVPQV